MYYHLLNSKLGGPGIVCQIDETKLNHKPKYNVGNWLRTELWAFGIVDTSYSPSLGYTLIVDQRNKRTLYPIIQRICLSGTIIHSDQRPAYAAIQRELGFETDSVNHSLNFVNPITGAGSSSAKEKISFFIGALEKHQKVIVQSKITL
ncbi:hypothetical protein ENBRE01_3300 [Enteropsectra breve]|nr:hypothetical protein ENBRE01_3300 [Enteropsectra breve]